MSETTYNANLIFTPPVAVNSFISTEKPGNVAVCLSGGGSRAMVSGMGQLLALETLVHAGASLLSQTKMLSTVSGGSWVGVPFTFLTPGTSDEAFLCGPYTPPKSLTVDGISSLPEGCVATEITSGFTLLDLAAEAWLYHELLGVPDDMLWQVLISRTFLNPYGLFQQVDLSPTTYFTYDQDTEDPIQKENSGNSLNTETANMVAQVTGQSRPFFVCNMGMKVPNNVALVPVQSTPFFTGDFSLPPVTDVNGRNVGGGGVTSFGFNSKPASLSSNDVSLTQSRQWTLVDIIGTSSAAYADLLIQIFGEFAARPPLFAATLSSKRESILRKATQLGLDTDRAASIIDNAVAAVLRGDIATHRANLSFSFDPTAIVPSYQYWSPADSTGNETVNPSFFADGGSLENTGVAAALLYSDIQNVISFLNSVTPIKQDANCVIVVDEQIPPLFGYQPYDENLGYVLYSDGDIDPDNNAGFANNQIFASEQFHDLLTGLWNASGNGSYLNSPIFKQQLTTVENKWFGVAGNATVNVLWVYLENTLSWSKELPADVLSIERELVSSLNFPHYNTFTETELDPQEIHLLANLTAWTVFNNAALFQSMYE